MPALEGMPDTLGPYRLLERIGQGGMGAVYLGRDPDGGLVAIKILHPRILVEEPAARRRLAREVEMMRRVRSRYVAEVVDADVTGEHPYIVTRYIPGRTLEDVVRTGGPLPFPVVQRLACGLAEALAAVHAAGVVHRDLKPGNVIVSGDDPVLIDFGIAHAPDATRLTQTGMFMGTPGYLAPEVIEGKPITPASDVHSWGATVAFAATGRPPFGTGPYQSVFYRIIGGQADLDGMPAPLRTVVSAAMARDPRVRPTAAALCAQFATLGWPADAGRGAVTDGAGGASPRVSTGLGATAVAAATKALDAPGLDDSNRGLPGPPVVPSVGAARTPTGTIEDWDDVADLLPPACYMPPDADRPVDDAPADHAGRFGRPVGPYPADVSRSVRPHRLLSIAALVLALSVSVLLPVAGTLVSVAAITLLRAADRAQRALLLRRSVRGRSALDPLVVVGVAPFTVARSVLTTLLLAPVALLVAAAAAIATLVAAPAHPLGLAGSYGAAALVGCYAVGPGSRRPRRQLHRIFGALSRTRGGAVVTVIVLCSLAAATLLAAGSEPPLYWPTISGWLPHLPRLSGLIHVGHLHLGWVDIPRLHLPRLPSLRSVRLPRTGRPMFGG